MHKSKPRGGIERKILMSILWVGILPVAIALVAGLLAARVGQSNAVEQTLITAVETTVAGVRFAATSLFRVPRTLAGDPGVAAVLSQTASPEIRRGIQVRMEQLSNSTEDGGSILSLYDTRGRLVMSTREDVEERDLSRFSWVGDLVAPRFAHVDHLAPDSRYTARIVAPVFAPGTEERLGFVSETVGITSLLKYAMGRGVKSDSIGRESDVYQVIYGTLEGMTAGYLEAQAGVEPPPLTRESADPTLVELLRNPDAGKARALYLKGYRTHGASANVFLAYQRMFPEYDAYLVVYRPASVVFTDLNRGALLGVLGSVLVIAVLCVIAYRNVHKNIVLPVALLNEGAQIIRQGDLELKLVIGTGDEIEELASSFNKMALALKGNIRQLEESEEKYRSLVTSMRDGIYQTDVNDIITFLNPAGCEIYGYARMEEAMGQNLQELFLEEIDLARFTRELDANGYVERSRVWMKRKDGRAICVELTANRILDEDGNVIGTEGTFRDVTKSVRLEQEARERSERIVAINQIANVINSSLEAGRLYESLVVEVKKLVDFDYAALALMSGKGDGFDARQLWPEQPVRPGYRYVLDGEKSCAAWVARERRCLVVHDLRTEHSEYLGDFPEHTVSCVCVPLYAIERIIGTLNLGANRPGGFSKHDVEVLGQVAPHVAVAIRNAQLLENLQASLEEVTRAREKLHEANEELKTLDEMKTNLLSNVSHELRTPLVSVMGYTDMIYNGKAGAINEVQKEYLSISLRNVEKLVTLIENLLDFSRLHRGAEKPVFDTFDLVDCARSSLQIIRPVAEGRELALRLAASEEPVLVDGDKGKIGQVFNNLLSNAVKFNRHGGSVTVAIRTGLGSVEVAVSDTGIGIPPEALDKVFTRFYQYDSSSTRKYGGTGIGLSIAQDIMRLHGSRITVTSEVEKGSVFRFSMPLHESQRLEVEAEQQAPPAETRLLVELISKERAMCAEVRTLLVSEGMDVIHAAVAAHALALAGKHHPDCVLIDLDSFEDGPDILDALIADSTAGDLPIILITAQDDVYSRCRGAAAARLMPGFRKSSLLGAIHHAVSQRAGTSSEPSGKKILCVDDDPEVLVFLQRCLTAEGYEVDCCESGEEAVTRASTGAYGLVMLDIAMPGLDGWETLRRIRANNALAGTKVCMVTAKPLDGDMPRGHGLRADGYILKPFRPEDIRELLQGLEAFPSMEHARRCT